MHSVHNKHENNAQIDGYTCITYLQVYESVQVCVFTYMFQLQNQLTDFDLITHQRYATVGHC